MRVTIPVVGLDRGGGSRVLVQIAEGLVRYGHEARFMMPRQAVVDWEISVPIHRVHDISPYGFPPADAILANYWPTVLPAFFSKRAGKVLRLSQGFEPLWVPDPLARRTYELPIPVLAVSKWLADLIHQETGRQAKVIPLGIDQHVFRPPPAPVERRGLLYVWRHSRLGYDFKGSEEFAKALHVVMTRYPDLPVTLVSPQDLPINLPYPVAVKVPANDAELGDLYRCAAVFVSNSWFEGFSLCPLEAMACGAPVVSTDCGGINEYARNGVNSLLVPPRDPLALAKAIMRVLDNPMLAETLGEAGIRTAQNWSWVRTWDAVDSALRLLVAE